MERTPCREGDAFLKATAQLWDPVMQQTFDSMFPDCGELPLPSLEFLDSMTEDSIVEVARCLLQHGADPLLKDALGISATEYAKRAGRPRLASLLENFRSWKECDLHFRLHVLPLTASLQRHVYNFLSDSFDTAKVRTRSDTSESFDKASEAPEAVFSCSRSQ